MPRKVRCSPRFGVDWDTDPRQRVELMTSVRGQRLADEDVDSEIFAGKTFCMWQHRLMLHQAITDACPDVIKGDAKNNKAALEALIHKHGGDFTQAQLSDQSALVISPDEKGTTAPDNDEVRGSRG